MKKNKQNINYKKKYLQDERYITLFNKFIIENHLQVNWVSFVIEDLLKRKNNENIKY